MENVLILIYYLVNQIIEKYFKTFDIIIQIYIFYIRIINKNIIKNKTKHFRRYLKEFIECDYVEKPNLTT